MPGPLVIAHRGACGYRPEHTASAFRLAVEQGAAAIEIDLVASADGALVVRHEPELSGTTDVAAHPELEERRRTKDVDGRSMRGWFTEDLSMAELRTLRARERLPRLRPASAGHDGEEGLLELREVLALTAQAGIVLVVELKHAERSAALGLPLDDLLVAELAAAPALPRIVVESFERPVLDRLAALGSRFPHPLVALAGHRLLADRPLLADPHSFDGLAGVSLRTGLVRPAVVARFRERDLDVWAWTLRPENRFLPPRFRTPTARFGRYRAYWRSLAAAGVTGVFADHPDLAVDVLRDPPRVGARA